MYVSPYIFTGFPWDWVGRAHRTYGQWYFQSSIFTSSLYPHHKSKQFIQDNLVPDLVVGNPACGSGLELNDL